MFVVVVINKISCVVSAVGGVIKCYSISIILNTINVTFWGSRLVFPFFLNSSTKLINKERQNQLYSYAPFPGRFF